MAVNKKTAGKILIGTAIVLVVGGILYFFRCKIFNLASCVEDPNVNNTPVPVGSPTPKWVPETFPLNIGMFGAKIKALQIALGINADGKFGNQTKGAVIAKGYSVPLSNRDYNKITGDTEIVNAVKGAYAKYDTTIFNLVDHSVNRKAKTGEWLGNISYTSDDNKYYVLDGKYEVAKDAVTVKI